MAAFGTTPLPSSVGILRGKNLNQTSINLTDEFLPVELDDADLEEVWLLHLVEAVRHRDHLVGSVADVVVEGLRHDHAGGHNLGEGGRTYVMSMSLLVCSFLQPHMYAAPKDLCLSSTPYSNCV